MDTPKPIGQPLDDLLEQVMFADPRTTELKAIWHECKANAQILLGAMHQENIENLLEYHRAQGTPDAESVAFAEASALRQELIEERDAQLAATWEDIMRQVKELLAEKKGE